MIVYKHIHVFTLISDVLGLFLFFTTVIGVKWKVIGSMSLLYWSWGQLLFANFSAMSDRTLSHVVSASSFGFWKSEPSL